MYAQSPIPTWDFSTSKRVVRFLNEQCVVFEVESYEAKKLKIPLDSPVINHKNKQFCSENCTLICCIDKHKNTITRKTTTITQKQSNAHHPLGKMNENNQIKMCFKIYMSI